MSFRPTSGHSRVVTLGYLGHFKNWLSLICSACQVLSEMVWHYPLAPTTTEEMHFGGQAEAIGPQGEVLWKLALKLKVLKIWFYRWSMLWEFGQFKFFWPPWRPQWCNPHLWAKAQNKKSGLTCLFSASNTFQNGMTWPISTNNDGGDTFLVYGLIRGQAKTVQPQPEVLLKCWKTKKND